MIIPSCGLSVDTSPPDHVPRCKMRCIFETSIHPPLITRYNCSLKNIFAKPLLFSMTRLPSFIATKFLNNPINSQPHPSTNGNSPKHRILLFMKYLAVYLVATLILASVSTIILYYLVEHYRSLALSSKGERIDSIPGIEYKDTKPNIDDLHHNKDE